jgi:hypothetical protein
LAAALRSPSSRLDATIDELQRMQIGLQGPLLMGRFERGRSQPLAACDAPGLLGHPQPVAQQELAHAVSVAHPVDTSVLARRDQTPGRLDLLAGDRDRSSRLPAGSLASLRA